MLPRLLALAAAGALPPHHPAHRAPASLLGRIEQSNPASLEAYGPTMRAPRAGHRVTPVEFGADPTGRVDSWKAINASLEVCIAQGRLSPNGHFPGDTSFGNGHVIRDMGGCIVDLAGGEYIISRPVVLPEYLANMEFGGGSLVASPEFEGDFLFVIGVEGSCRVPQASCNIDINFPNLYLDGRGSASGMQINNVMGVTIGPGGYFLNFTSYGVQINGGHEVMMDRVWLGETNFDYDHVAFAHRPNATAIAINGNDHYVTHTIVFSSRVGMLVRGAANNIRGVHVWFPLNHATAFPDTKAFYVTAGGNRFDGCYIDGGRGVFERAGLVRNVWTNGFECCQIGKEAAGTPHSGIVLVGNIVGPGFEVVHNEFKKPVQHYPFVRDGVLGARPYDAASDGPLKVTGSVIAHNSVIEGALGTQATLSQSRTNATSWSFNFCKSLVFPQIAVETNVPMTGTITVDVDSSAPSTKFH
eukprot:TRINITY_DN1959_c1_g1_i4.p1 TRINITY_DN1959_c1_g1~~TRINITY_DN1959_c1_g1_i4.p1  ORF type:complete len:471 (+),score=87.65 TRINITY_DN1959_c1_g1_i4:73-1485(+)